MREKLNKSVINGEAWVSAVEKVFQYGPAILGLIGMSGLGAWFASGWTALSGQGWGGFAFAGVGMACVVTLVASAGLVAWRYFKPLPAPIQERPQAAESPVIIDPAAVEAAAQRAKAEEIKRNQFNDRIRSIQRGLHMVIWLQLERLNRMAMERAIADEPKYSYDEDISESTSLLKERTLLLNNYVRMIESNLKPRASNLRAMLKSTACSTAAASVPPTKPRTALTAVWRSTRPAPAAS